VTRVMHYMLDGHTPIPVADVLTWARWFETGDRTVKQDRIDEGSGVDVSTVFLGLDHNWGDGPPILFETMVFNGPLDQAQDRYATWEDAEAGHAAMVQRVRAAMTKDPSR
jgi:hypothetical protein